MPFDNINDQYKALLLKSTLGEASPSRTGFTCYSAFAPAPIKTDQFPIISLRKQFWKSIVIELIWLLRGHSRLDFLQKHGVNFWNDWADENNSLGRAYPPQFRNVTSHFTQGSDPFGEVLSQVGDKSDSRRLVVDIWNGAELEDMTIPPCCFAHQVRIVNDKVHMFVFQRSCDVLVGLPQNMATYGLLQHIYAKVAGLPVGVYHHLISDAHVYANQVRSAKKIIEMNNKSFQIPFVSIDNSLDSTSAFLEFLDDSDQMSTEEIMNLFQLHNYKPNDYFPVAVNI